MHSLREWTLHSDPAPARPSYRLVLALQLLHAAEAQPLSLLEWEDVAAGRKEEISTENTKRVRGTLLSLCNEYLSEAFRALDKAQETLFSDQDRGAGEVDSLALLWERQKALVESVIDTIKKSPGLDFQ
jgi:hypothetical protein